MHAYALAIINNIANAIIQIHQELFSASIQFGRSIRCVSMILYTHWCRMYERTSFSKMRWLDTMFAWPNIVRPVKRALMPSDLGWYNTFCAQFPARTELFQNKALNVCSSRRCLFLLDLCVCVRRKFSTQSSLYS